MLTLPQLPTEKPLAERLARIVARSMAALLAIGALAALPSGVARAIARVLGGALAVIGLIAFSTRAAYAVTVSPTALYITSRNPSALLTLINTGTRPEEIELTIGFGYPVSDSAGVLRVDIVDSGREGDPSLTSFLRVFPRRLVLQPGQRQVVRVMVAMPAGVADGEYWGRVLVKSRGGEPPIEQSQGDVRMQLSLETTFATAVFDGADAPVIEPYMSPLMARIHDHETTVTTASPAMTMKRSCRSSDSSGISKGTGLNDRRRERGLALFIYDITLIDQRTTPWVLQ